MERLLALSARRDRRFNVDGRWAAPVAGVSFVAVFVLSLAISHADAPLVLLVVPVAILAIAYGLLGGVVGAGVAVVLTGVSLALAGGEVSALGYFSRSTAFVVVGVLVGRYVDQRQALLTAIRRHQEVSLDAIGTITFDGFFESVNPAWTRMLGYSEQELLEHPFITLVHPDDVERTMAEATRLAESAENSINFRNRYRTKDGSYRWLEWVSTSVPEEQRFYVVARDVTEKKQAEEWNTRHQEILEKQVRERTRELDSARLETLQRLAYAAEYRDDQTYEHTERVGRTAARIAEQLGLPEEDVQLIRQAAPLHDVGKLGIPDSILLKPGKLTPAEFERIKTHSLLGARILSGSNSRVLQVAEEIARTHHEHWDGSGYPHALRGAAIPLTGRIVAVADVFDALTHERPYRRAISVRDAIREVSSLAGSQFDPEVVFAFNRLHPAQLLEPIETPLATAV